LYRDPQPTDDIVQGPFRAGVTIALIDPASGWLTPGIVNDASVQGRLTVVLVDDTVRTVPIDDSIMLLQSAPIPPLELFSWFVPSALAVFAGLPTTREPANWAWIAAAVAWAAPLVAALISRNVTRL